MKRFQICLSADEKRYANAIYYYYLFTTLHNYTTTQQHNNPTTQLHKNTTTQLHNYTTTQLHNSIRTHTVLAVSGLTFHGSFDSVHHEGDGDEQSDDLLCRPG